MLNLNECVSPYDFYCAGYGNPGASGKMYLLGFSLGVGKSPFHLKKNSSDLLNATIAFDRAEIDDVYLGQTNMITVSSFCGLTGLLWGYDLLRSKKLFIKHPLYTENLRIKKDEIPVYSASPLIESTRYLFGTIKEQHFPILPGSHVPCALKSLKKVGPAHIYSSFALGIPANRKKNACLLMEDVGEIPLKAINKKSKDAIKKNLLQNLAQSVIEIGNNQGILYKEIFIEIKDIVLARNEVGCSLVALPYFTLAKNAIPEGKIENLIDMKLDEWEMKTKSFFLH